MGHLVGDELLRRFAKKVGRVLRDSDMLARQGGDEFLILLPHVQNEEAVKKIAARILSTLREDWEIDDYIFSTTSSLGISMFPQDGEGLEELFSRADEALYRAKESGKDQWIMFS